MPECATVVESTPTVAETSTPTNTIQEVMAPE